VVPFLNSAARELRDAGSRRSPRTDMGTEVMITGMKFGGGSAMLLRFAVFVGEEAPATGVAAAIPETREFLGFC
jgi:hypothetical protein